MRTIGMSFVRVAASVTVACLASCRAGGVPEQPLSRPGPVAARPAAVQVAPTLWVYRVPVERRTYAIDHRALLSIRQDTVLRSDSITVRAELAFTTFGGGARVTGTVGSFRVQTAGHEPATPSSLTLPLAFSATLPGRGRQLVFTTGEGSATCPSMEAGVISSLRDLFFLAPDTLRVGTTWEDSTTYVVCRDGLPLRATVVRVFRVTGSGSQGGRTVLTLGRHARTTLEGGGRQAGEPVEVAGTGSGELSYTADPANGEILSAAGSATLELTLRSRLRVQLVRQTSDLQIGRRP